MKKINIITLGLFSAAAFMTSCSESFLEVESFTQDFVDTYLHHRGAYRAVAGCRLQPDAMERLERKPI